MKAIYAKPAVISTDQLTPQHIRELEQSFVDPISAGLGGVCSIDHGKAYDLGIRGPSALGGICYRYWNPAKQRFSKRFFRIKPDVQVAGRKYLQPVGERPRLFFIAGTTLPELDDSRKAAFITEGEKKSLALDRAAREMGVSAVVVGLGGVWSWRHSKRELQPDGTLGKGRSMAIGDLDLIRWTDRTVYLFFDSDVLTNWRVAAAETALARELERRGARVYCVRLPRAARWKKSA